MGFSSKTCLSFLIIRSSQPASRVCAFLKVGAEEGPTWQNLLRGSQHADHHVGEAPALTPRVTLQLYGSV